MQKNSEGLYRRLLMVLFGAALLHLFDSLSLEARGQEVRTFQPGQVDCSSPPLSTPPNIDVVQVPTGVQTVDEYCQVQGPIQAQQRGDRSPWGPSYQIGNTICRDRRNVDTVCVTPSTAVRLRWNVP
jgi:hypothetical protein